MISGTDENGEPLFSHEYRFVDGLSLAGLMDGYLYETEDEDAGEFKYFYDFRQSTTSIGAAASHGRG